MRKFALALLALTVVVTLAAAHEWRHSGYVDGYATYHGDHHYWKGSDAYTRKLVSEPGYYANGYYYAGRSYYQYTFAYTYKAPVSHADPDWRNKLLDIAAQRDKAEAKLRLNAHEQQYFLEAVKALGLEGNFRWNGYGVAPPYAHGHHGYSSLVAQGNTAYGYSLNTIASVYGDTNLNVLYQQAARLTDNAQKLAGQAHTEFGTLVGQEGANRAKVAEILARGQAAQEFLRALEAPSAKFETRQFTFRVGPDGKMEKVDVAPVMPKADEGAMNLKQLWQQLAARDCASCHSGKRVEGGFNLIDYPSMTPDQRARVIDRLVTQDPSKRMPRLAGGGAAPPLHDAVVNVWKSLPVEGQPDR